MTARMWSMICVTFTFLLASTWHLWLLCACTCCIITIQLATVLQLLDQWHDLTNLYKAHHWLFVMCKTSIICKIDRHHYIKHNNYVTRIHATFFKTLKWVPIHTYSHMHTHIHYIQTQTQTHTHIHHTHAQTYSVCVCLSVCMCVHPYLCLCVFVCVRVHVYACVWHMYVHMYMCECVCN